MVSRGWRGEGKGSVGWRARRILWDKEKEGECRMESKKDSVE